MEDAAERADTRTLAEKHKDIEFSNTYRVEYIKHLMSVAAGIFAFTLVFTKDFLSRNATDTVAKPLMLIGWAALLTSLIAGVMHMRFWASYYVSWAKSFYDPSERAWREQLDRSRKATELVQILSFILGLALLLLFAAANMYA